MQEITYDDKGGRVENVTFAPQNTLRQLSFSREDYQEFRYKMAFVLTTSDLPQYNLLYVGQQHQDEIDTYVFDIAPKTIVKGQRYFQGRIWVDNLTSKFAELRQNCVRCNRHQEKEERAGESLAQVRDLPRTN